MKKAVLVYITAGSRDEAERLVKTLVKERLVACVNYFPINSCFLWENKIEKSREYVLLCKTLKSNFKKIQKRVREIHSYSTPAVMMIDLSDVDSKFFRWIVETIK